MNQLRVSIVVPSYQRPKFLVNCLEGISRQTHAPNEVIVVLRHDDAQSNSAVARMVSEGMVRLVTVNQPGFLPPLREGIQHSTGDIVCFVDDDAVPRQGWLKELLVHYDDPSVGAVGGRVVNIRDGKEVIYPMARVMGRIGWWGRIVGNLYCDSLIKRVMPVDFIQGGNASFRTEVLRKLKIDNRLNHNVASHWEIDWCFQTRRLGYRILYEPNARVDHFMAPRAMPGMRDMTNPESIYWYSHNYTLVMLKHLPVIRRLAFLVYFFLVGQRASWGIASMLYAWLCREPACRSETIAAAYRGKLAGIRSQMSGQS